MLTPRIMPKDLLSEMLENSVHFGHKTTKWNPKMKKYIFGVKNGIHIFDLEKTAECLDKATDFLQQNSAAGKTILLVSTKLQAADLIESAAKEINMPYVVHKWIGGLLTNFATMKKRISYFNKLWNEDKAGELSKYTKKEASKLKKELTKLQAGLGGVKTLDKMPDVIFLADVVRDRIVVKEANRLKIPVVGICDTNSDPDGIAYPIPANDDAVKSLTYLINTVKDAILAGRKSK